MKKQKIYEVTDLDEFIKSLRSIVIENFYENEGKNTSKTSKLEKLMNNKKEEIQYHLSIQEAQNIIKPMLKATINNIGDTEYTVSHKGFKKILDELNKRIVSNILTELSSEGLIESGFDDEKNDFIFWVVEEKN